MNKKTLFLLPALIVASGITACDSNDSDKTTSGPAVSKPATYTYTSQFSAESSVSYSGQTARQVLISGLNSTIESGIEDLIASGTLTSANTADDVLAILNSYYIDGTDTLANDTLSITTTPATSQANYGDISLGKNLQGKIAGNDSATDHKDWDAGDFVGWTADSPDALVQKWFNDIANNTVANLNGNNRTNPIDGASLSIYQTEDGLDLKQLTQKFLLAAINFSQGTDDYLDDATESKGILSSNIDASGDDKPYTTLEHQWDEGFGYFGAARNYNDYTDDEIASKGGRDEYQGYNDANADGMIDLNAEFNFGHSTNAAKRDRGSQTGTDFSTTIFDAFLQGRAIINATEGALDDDQFAALQAERNIIVLNWEKAIASTVVHYINDVLADMDNFGTANYSYNDHIKHWAELKGFALSFQFNPRSPMSDADFASLHELLTERPVLPNAEQAAIDNYVANLLSARTLIAMAYEFADEDAANW